MYEKSQETYYIFRQGTGGGLQVHLLLPGRPLGLTGWVKNLWNGDVEMEVQGEPLAIGRFLRNLEQGRFIHIEHMEAEDIPVIEEGSFREIY